MSRSFEGRRGAALLLAVTVLAAVGMISLTALALARAERVAGLTAVARVQARAAAEAALAEVLKGWPAASTPSTPGEELELAHVTVPGPAEGWGKVRALGGPIFAVVGSGIRASSALEPLGSVRLELLVLLEPPDSSGTARPRRYPRGWRLLP
jgi:hypothetical protein